MRTWAAVAVVLVMGLSLGSRAQDGPSVPSRTDLSTMTDSRRVVPDVVVKVSLDGEAFRPLEPIDLALEAENVSDRAYMISGSDGPPPYGDYRRFHVKVFDQRGRPVPTTRFAEWDLRHRGLPVGQSGGSGGSYFMPGGVVRGRVSANLAYDMTSPGEYTIIVEFPIFEHREQAIVRFVARSRPIKVKVLEPAVGRPAK